MSKKTKLPANSKTDKTKEVLTKIFDYVKSADPQRVLAIATIFLVVIGWYQSCKVKESMEISNKAYICVDNVMGGNPGSESINFFDARITFVNSGETPAYDVKIRANLKICEDESMLTDVKKFQIINRSAILGRGESTPIVAVERERTTADTSAMIISGKLRIFFHGQVTYKDIFDDSRFLNFRFYYRHDALNSMTSFEFCENGNSTDK